MYQVYLGYLPLPITPSRIETTINNRNETLDLIDGSQINILRQAGLQEIDFEFLIPNHSYPFASAVGKALNAVTGGLGALGGLLNGATNTAMLYYLEYLKSGNFSSVGSVVGMVGSGIESVGGAIGSSSVSSIGSTVSGIGDSLNSTNTNPVPFQFIVVRKGEKFSLTNAYNINKTMALEEYSIIEDAEETGTDILVQVRLKEYKAYSTILLDNNGKMNYKRGK